MSLDEASIPTPLWATPEQRRSVTQIAELAGGLAHELRNPLSTMMINLRLLAEDLEGLPQRPEDVRRRALLKVEGLRREAERLQSLFEEFLSLTGPCGLQRSETDLNTVVAALVEFFEPQARDHNLQITVVPAADPLPCPVDRNLLRQALLNIVINAQQAMPEGGALRITTAVEGNEAVIALTDTGVGINEADLERIFRPFFSTKPGGSGLGLSVTQRIVAEHGGTLSCTSEAGTGTTFTIRLPLRPPDWPESPSPG